VHLVLDNRYTSSTVAELAAGCVKFSLGGDQTTTGGRIRTIRDLSEIVEFQIAPFSFPRDIPWVVASPALSSRDELSVLIQEYSVDSYETPSREANHHFRGWFDSTEVAAYLYYFATIAATIAADINAHNNAIVRWYEPVYHFGFPVAVTSDELTFEFRRGDNLVPFHPCEFLILNIILTVGVSVRIVFDEDVAGDAIGDILANDVIVVSKDLRVGGIVEVVGGTQYTVASTTATSVLITSLLPTGNGSYGGFGTDALVLVPKFRFRMNMRARGLTTDAQTTHRRP
jgi:hypothetical protein